MITGAQVSEAARSLVGTPYVHQGRTPFGVDCIGFVILSRHMCGGWLDAFKESTNYARKPKDGLLLDRVTAHCTRIDGPEDGCMMLIKFPSMKYASHCGVYAQANIIHAYGQVKKVVETRYGDPWLRWTHSFWRLPGVVP